MAWSEKVEGLKRDAGPVFEIVFRANDNKTKFRNLPQQDIQVVHNWLQTINEMTRKNPPEPITMTMVGAHSNVKRFIRGEQLVNYQSEPGIRATMTYDLS